MARFILSWESSSSPDCLWRWMICTCDCGCITPNSGHLRQKSAIPLRWSHEEFTRRWYPLERHDRTSFCRHGSGRATREVVIMNRRQLATAVLSTAVGLALGMQASPRVAAQIMANPPQVVKDNMARMQQQHLEKC